MTAITETDIETSGAHTEHDLPTTESLVRKAYQLGFSAAKHPFHMPDEDEALAIAFRDNANRADIMTQVSGDRICASGVIHWIVTPSPTDAEMYAVQGAYLVADQLPIEDADLIAASRELLAAVKFLLPRVDKHRSGCSAFETDGCTCVESQAWDAAFFALKKAEAHQ